VALLAINPDRTASQAFEIPIRSERYTLTAKALTDGRIQLNGRELDMGAGDQLPELRGEPVPPGQLVFPPVSIIFLALLEVNNSFS
jgi:heparanase